MKPKPSGFRVDLLVNETGLYTAYTSKKIPVTRAMADSLAAHLKRGDGRGRNSGGRIVEVPSEVVVEEWRANEHQASAAT